MWAKWMLAPALVAALAGCGNDWRTDMWYQPSLRPEAAPRPEPDRSVRVGAPLPLLDRDDAQDWKSPEPSSEASVERGAKIFADRCACCHNADGHGNGPVSKKGFPPAPDLAYASIRARSDGFIYATMTLGGRAMPPVADGLTPRDRWDVVHFVRARIQGAAPGEQK